MPLRWPFSGRTRQTTQIDAWIADPEVAGVVLSGSAGVGKSRSIREALNRADARGYATRWVVGATSASEIPLAAFTAWIPSGLTDTVQLLRGVIASLTDAQPGEHILVCVDDAQLLDGLSAFVIHQIVQRGAAKVIITLREGDPVPPSIQEILRLARFERLHLEPLSPNATATLLESTLAGAVEPASAQRLWQMTGGNPLYLRNIVEHEVTNDRLTQQGGIWRWTGDPTIPPDLIGLVESRIGALPEHVADVLDVLAVVEPVDLAVLHRITSPAAVEEAELREVITVEAGARARVRVAHPMYGEVRRHRTAKTRLRRLRGLVASELAAADDSDDIHSVVKRGALSIDSDLPPDIGLLVNAARGAVWLADLHLADRLAQAAIAAGAGPEPVLIRAHALSWSGRGEEAEAVLKEVSSQQHPDNVRARIGFLRASNILWALGDLDGAKKAIEEVSDVSSTEARNYIDAFNTVYWFAADQPNRVRDAAKTFELEALPPVVGAEIAWVIATVAADAGETDKAISMASRGYEVAARALDAPQMRFNIADAQVGGLLLAGRLAEAMQQADDVQREARHLPGAAQSLGAAVAGRAMLGGGRLGTAVSLLGHAVGELSATHSSGWAYRYRIPLATALAMCGKSSEAAAELVALDQAQRGFRMLDYERRLARAWLAASEGVVSEAIDNALAGALGAARASQFAAEVLCRQTATQFGDRTSAERLNELEGLVEGPRAHLAARFAAALQIGDPEELRSVAAGFEEIGDLVAALDACSHAAIHFRRMDLRGSALASSSAAAALAERCGGVVTPALRLAAEPLPLTERERELVMLIAQGLSNREIAGKLTLSVRTVESHLYRAMSKTGTTTRAELAALVSQTRPTA